MVFFHSFTFVSSVKSVSGPMASTTTLKYGPKISLSHVTMKGGGGPDPFIVKDYEKGPFFAALPKLLYSSPHLEIVNPSTYTKLTLRHPSQTAVLNRILLHYISALCYIE